MTIRYLRFLVGGMHCSACSAHLESTLKALSGVLEVTVNLSTATVSANIDTDLVTPEKIDQAVRGAGFSVDPVPVSFLVQPADNDTVSAAAKVALQGLNGVLDVSQSGDMVTVSYHPLLADPSQFVPVLKKAGFSSVTVNSGFDDLFYIPEHEKDELSGLRNRTILGFAGSAVLMGLMMFGHPLFAENMFLMDILMLVIATPILVVCAYPIFRQGISQLRGGMLGMEVMYMLGIVTSYLAGLAAVAGFLPSPDFLLFETAVMLTAFLGLGRFLESRARGRTSDAIMALLHLRPPVAMVVRDGVEQEVRVGELVAGDTVLVKTGGQIPSDGIVLGNSVTVNESAITGEPVPVMKVPGSGVIGGTVVSQGVLTMEVEKVGADTVLAGIIRMVREAQETKPPVQRVADAAVRYFIPFVLGVAVLAFVYWFFFAGETLLIALSSFIAVIVVACPCALGLATPTAVTVGIGRAASLGILIRNGEVLERAGKLNSVAVDKTGTLTVGSPAVSGVVAVSGTSEADLFAVAATLGRKSLHPLDSAIVAEADRRGAAVLAAARVETVPGRGMTARVNREDVVMGSAAFLEERGVSLDDAVSSAAEGFRSTGASVVFVAVGEKVAGVIGVSDTLRSDAGMAVLAFERMGLPVTMLTGDNARAAEVVARLAGISHVEAGLMPDEKRAIIQKMQDEGKAVVFVGDGINDTPAMTQADVGVAVGSGTDAAVASGGIVLLRSDLIGAVAAVQLARKVFSRIRMNLFWAFAYNLFLIPLAAGVLYPFTHVMFRPEYAAAAMVLSSVTVVSLSLLLRRYTPPALVRGEGDAV
ncbi:heavy metal translocating P-type ATPase [Methanocorpusculum sp. MG]|uniref:Heavy metal translocating P-type ATPase n=1 Tax=Methanocorpusculum petauri TaxID=3002863 RepID=A0ABT4IG24_9EURY|nr:heavy metal translocating P-type ATPase [Methanocorpusculum petauri]MCZ0860683.1 heavy metal translocating P-type ATPase [Methanocorpusculum petauri]